MTFRLGLRLTLRGGREAGIRLGLVAAAVAIGVGVLLSVLADLHAFDATGGRPCWECTQGTPLAGHAPAAAGPGAELWNYSEDYYQGRPIERLDVAALGPDAPIVPGLTRMPGPGRYDVSPALAALLGSTPADQLGDRFPGTRAGEIGPAALSSPDELVIVVGYTPARLAAMPATAEVSALSTRPQVNSTSTMYRYGFGIAAIGMLFPVLVLIGTASRLAAARREERFAAFRLVGATSRQVNVIASVEAIAGALVGTLAGIGVFLLLRPGVARVAVTGSRYYEALVTPTLRGYLVVLIGVPAGAVCAALWSLRRVRISPLGATRRTTPRPPGWWRTLPLLLGLVLVVIPLAAGGHPDAALVDVGLLMIMIGLMVGGSWLTMRAARLLPRLARGASALLAARRLADNPKAAFRAVSGLVLAVFVGTALAGVVPAVIKGQQAVASGALTDVLRASFTSGEMPSCVGTCDATPTGPATTVADGLPPATGAELVSRLRSEPGTTVLPLYAAPEPPGAASPSAPGPQAAQGVACGPDACVPEHREIVSCAALRSLPALGRCAPGETAVSEDFSNVLLVDNMLAIKDDLPVIGPHSPPTTIDLSTLKLAAVMVDIGDPATLERVRTLLATYSARAGATNAPQTFGEIAQARAFIYNQIDRGALAMVALTLLVAGCSLVVAVGGGLVERKRPFTLLRLSGTPAPTLYAVVLYESLLPLVAAAAVAAGVGLAVSEAVVSQLRMTGVSHIGLPGPTYFLTTGGGLVASFAVILAALPLLRRVTRPENARFE